MKKTIRNIGALVVLFLFVLFFANGCGKNSSISLDKTEVTISLGEEIQIEVLDQVLEDLVWESEDPGVATVEEGKIVGVSEGTTHIIVTSGKLRSEIKVVVVLESERNYIITWVDHDGTVLEIDQEVQRGTIPTFDGTIPARNGFDFIGWDPEVTEAFSDQIYTAQYAAIADTHKITWKNWDGTLLVESMVYSGQTPVYSGPIPTKESDDYYDYMFIGWSPKLEPANYIRTYTAQFAGTKRVYTVTWIDTSVYNPDTNSYRVLYTEEVEAGTTPIYVGAQPTKPDDQNWGYKYIFDGWNPMPAHLTKDMEYKTNYVRAYDVRWYNWYNEPELLKEERLKMVEVTKPSGYTTMEIPETIEYDGPTPTIPDDYGYTYRFKGWFRLDSPLGNDNKMADREYIATYDCISKDDRYDPSKFEHYYGRYGSLPDCRITNYTGDFYADFYIPTWLDGEMVTGIDMVYDDSHPVGVRGAFEDNNRIVNLYLGDNLDEFNHNTFRGCTNLQNIHFGKNMKYLGLWMFENCTSLSSVTIPEQIEKIDWGAFCGCTNLLTVTFSEGLEIIETLAFSECANLTTITLPNSLTHVDGFDGCTRLHTVNLGAGVTWILDWCFAGNVALQNINLGEVNLEYIGSYAFKDCSSLTKVDLPETLKTIGNHAFLRCTSLNEVNFKGTIPQLESIDDWAFLECSELRSLSIPASVIRIGEGIVGSCEKLSSLEVSHANQKYRSKDNMIIDIEKEKIIAGCNASGDIPTDHTVTVIGTGAFYDCKTYNQNKTLIIPSNIKKIEGSAFYQCIGLPSIDPYEIVFTDHDRHYEDCPKSIIIPSTVEVIESLAFHLDYFPEEGENKRYFCIYVDREIGHSYNTQEECPEGLAYAYSLRSHYYEPVFATNCRIHYRYEGDPANYNGTGRDAGKDAYGYWHGNYVLWTWDECNPPKPEDPEEEF